MTTSEKIQKAVIPKTPRDINKWYNMVYDYQLKTRGLTKQ